jgi:hypothetical protein
MAVADLAGHASTAHQPAGENHLLFPSDEHHTAPSASESTALRVPPLTSDARRVRLLATWLLRLSFVGFAFNVVKGFPTRLQGLMWPNWEFTYRHGPVRRGLGGTLFQAFASGLDRGTQQNVVLVLHAFACATFFCCLSLWIIRSAKRHSPRTRLLATTGLAMVLLAPFTSTTVLLACYFDIYILLFALGGAYLGSRGKYLASGMITIPAPLIHDGFVFLWLPVMLLVAKSVWRAPLRQRLSALSAMGLPLVAFVMIMSLHTDERAFRVIDELPPDLWYSKGAFFSSREAVRRMLDNFRQAPAQLPLAFPVFVLPSLLVGACGYAIGFRRGWRNAFVCVAVTLAPCSVLLVAWDLSRFLVWSTLGGFLVLAWSLSITPRLAGLEAPSVPSRSTRVLCALVVSLGAVLSIGGPSLYAYFHVAFADYSIGPQWLASTPAARASYAWLRVYNRSLYVPRFPATSECFLRGQPAHNPCTFSIDQGHPAVTEPIWLPAGDYTAEVETEATASCREARGRLTFAFDWRLAPTATTAFNPMDSKIAVTLHLTGDAAAMGRLRVTLAADAGCYRLRALRIEPILTN